MFIPKNITRIALISLCVIMICSCLTKTFSESDSTLILDVETLELPGDMVSGEAVTGTVIVSSNRSWNAEIVPSVDWATIDVNEYEDLAGVSADVPVTLTFSDNESDYPRVANLLVTTSSGMKNVKLIQQPLEPRLAPVASCVADSLHYEGGEAIIDVVSNVNWTAAITEHSEGAGVVLDLLDTERNGNVKVTFAENFDLTSDKYAVVTFAAEGFEPVSVRVNQQKAVPYARVLSVTGGEDILAAIGGARTITVKSNVNWTVGVKDNAADNVTFSKTTGGKGETSVKMTFKGNPVFDERREFAAEFLTEVPGVDDGTNEHLFVQERGSLLRFVFSFNNTWYWPFPSERPSLSTGKPSYPDVATEFTTYSDNKITIYSKYGIWLNNTRGVNVGRKDETVSAVGDYIEFPVIEGRRLSKVVWESTNSSRTGTQIVSADEIPVVVGEEITSICEPGDLRIWDLTTTEVSKPYRIVLLRNTTMQTPVFECHYE